MVRSVVGLDNNRYDKSRIFERADDPSDKGVTLTELRRCYKLAHEFGEEMTKVAGQTFKFVRLVTVINSKQSNHSGKMSNGKKVGKREKKPLKRKWAPRIEIIFGEKNFKR